MSDPERPDAWAWDRDDPSGISPLDAAGIIPKGWLRATVPQPAKGDTVTGCPSSVVVGPHTYTIVVDADEAQRERVTHGVVDCVYTRVVVNPAQSDSQLRDTR
jgi:hypothetical protein